MKAEDKVNLRSTINNEGFDYAFTHYSDFSEIKDKKFHELRKKYLEAQEALQNYINEEELEGLALCL